MLINDLVIGFSHELMLMASILHFPRPTGTACCGSPMSRMAKEFFGSKSTPPSSISFPPIFTPTRTITTSAICRTKVTFWTWE